MSYSLFLSDLQRPYWVGQAKGITTVRLPQLNRYFFPSKYKMKRQNPFFSTGSKSRPTSSGSESRTCQTFSTFFYATLLLLPMMLFLSCTEAENRNKATGAPEHPVNQHIETLADPVYTVTRLSQPVEIDSKWDKDPWNDIAALHLNQHMGDEPDPRPEVYAKVAYDEEAIYVIFQVHDQYVRCVVDEYQGPVSRDSCVEFFFTPGTDISKGYFNLETNCGGTALFAFQKERGVERVNIPRSQFDRIDLAHSMPRIVEPEITNPVTWTIEYRLPIDILTRYTDISTPAPGVEWRANFYKIASGTSHPHYLTWSFVDHPVPQFHLPEFFGSIVFE